MLRHHAEEEHVPKLGLTPAPGQSQVTAQELAQAIVTVETRQRAHAPRPTQTVSLEHTIRQLELTVTPQELLAELHAQRTLAHQNAVMTPRKTGRNLSWWLMLVGLVLSTVTTACVSLLLFMMVKNYQQLSDAFHNKLNRNASTRPLTAFNPHDPAYVTFRDLRQLANGTSPATIRAAQWSNAEAGAQWGVEQENGRYVVRVNSQRTSANAADKTEWVVPVGAVSAWGNHTEVIPVERFKRIQDLRTIRPDLSSPYEEVLLLRGND